MKYFRNPSAAGRRSQQLQAEKRMALPAPDYPVTPDPFKLVKRISIVSFSHNGDSEIHVIELYPSRGQRRDRYRAMYDGRPWKDPASLTWLFAELRKAR